MYCSEFVNGARSWISQLNELVPEKTPGMISVEADRQVTNFVYVYYRVPSFVEIYRQLMISGEADIYIIQVIIQVIADRQAVFIKVAK